MTVSWTRSTRELLWAGEAEWGIVAAEVLMGPASGTSKLRLLVTENAERNFCLSCFLSDRLLSGGVDMVRGRPGMTPPTS